MRCPIVVVSDITVLFGERKIGLTRSYMKWGTEEEEDGRLAEGWLKAGQMLWDF